MSSKTKSTKSNNSKSNKDKSARNLEIVRLYKLGISSNEIARRYSLNGGYVRRIISDAGCKLRGKGFAGLSKEERSRISSLGGKAAHSLGLAHKFTSSEAVIAGAKGGRSAQDKGVAYKWDSATAAIAGAKGNKSKSKKKSSKKTRSKK